MALPERKPTPDPVKPSKTTIYRLETNLKLMMEDSHASFEDIVKTKKQIKAFKTLMEILP